MPGAGISVGVNLLGRDMLSGPINAASMRMRGFIGVTDQAAQRMRVATVVGAGFSTMLGIRLVGAMKNAIGTASRLEDIMISVKRIGGFTDEQIRKMSRSFLILSAQLPLSAEELARVGVIASRLGVKGTEALEKLAFTSAQLARSTVLTEETAASALARISRLFNLDVVKASNAVSSSMVAMATSSTATADEIANITVRMGGLAHVMGVSAAQAMALAATMRDAGLRVEMGGSAIMRILTNMTSKQEKFAKMLGMTMEAYKHLFRVDPMGAFMRLLHVISKLDKMEVAARLKEVGLANVRTTMTVMGLSRQLGSLQKNLNNSEQAFRAGTKVTEMYEMATKSLNAKISTFVGSVKNVFIVVGNYLLPVFKALVQIGIDILSIFLKLPTAVHIVIAGLFGLAGVAGVILAQFGALQLMMVMFTGTAFAAAGATGILATSLGFYQMAIGTVLSSMKSLLVEMGALIKKGVLLAKNLIVTNALALKAALRKWGLAGAYKYLNYQMGGAIRRGWAWIANLWIQIKTAAVATASFAKMGAMATWSFLRVAGGALKAATGVAAFGASLGPLLVVFTATAAVITAIVVITKVLMPLISQVGKLLMVVLVPVFKIVRAVVGAVVNIFKSLLFGMKILLTVAIIPLIIAVKGLGVVFKVLEFVLVPVLNAIAWMVRLVGVMVGPLAIMLGLIWAISNATRVWAAATWLWNAATGFAVKILGVERKQMLLNYWLKLKNLWVIIKTKTALYREAAAIWFESLRRGKGLVGLIKENALRAWNWITMKKQVLWTKIKLKWDWLSSKLAKKGIVWAKIRHALAWKNIRATIADTRAKIANWIVTKRQNLSGGRFIKTLFGTSTAAGGAAGSTGLLASAAAAAGVSVAALLGIVLAVIAAIAIFVVVAVKWYRAFKNASAGVKMFMVALIPLLALLSPIVAMAAAFATALWAVVSVVKFVVGAIKGLIGEDFMGVVTIWKEIKKVVSEILVPVQNLFNIFKGVGKETSYIKTLFMPLFFVFRAILEIWLMLARVMKTVIGVIAGALAPILKEVKSFVDFLMEVFAPITSLFDSAGKKTDWLGGVFRALNAVVTVALRPIVWLIKGLGHVLVYVMAVAKPIIEGLVSIFVSLWRSISATIGSVMELLGVFWDQLKALMEPVLYFFSEIGKLFGLAGKKAKGTGSVLKTIGNIVGLFIIAPLRVLSWIIRVNLFFLRIFVKVLTFFARIVAVVFKVLSAVTKAALWPFILGIKVAKVAVQAWLWVMLAPFKLLYWIVSKILKLFFGSSFLHIAEGIAKIMSPLWGLVKLFMKLMGTVKLVAKAIGAVWKVVKTGAKLITAPLKAAGFLAKKVFGGIGVAAKKGWEVARSVVTKPVEVVSKGLKAVGGLAKKAWGALFGSSFLHIAEGIWFVLPWLKRLNQSFSVLGGTMMGVKMKPAFTGIPAIGATVRHEVSREPIPVKVVTVAAAPATVPPPIREVLEIRARIPFIIVLDGNEIARGIKEIDDFDMIREYREPTRKFSGICE